MSLLILLSCSSDTDKESDILSSGDGKPYLITITNDCKDTELLLWCESEYLKYNETSDIIKGYKDTAEIAYRWSDKIYDNYPWDTIKFVVKNKTDINNFKMNK